MSKYIIPLQTAAKTVTIDLVAGDTIAVAGSGISASEIALNHVDPEDNVTGSVVDSLGTELVLSASSPEYTAIGPTRIQLVKGTTGEMGVWLRRGND